MMSTHERMQAVVEFGFTERQARFLVLVMRHAGVCVPRQYARFAGVAQGAKCNAFFEKLVRRGYASASECIHNRARVYHVHSKPLYHAIGEDSSRYRRSLSPRLAVERLMVVDAVLTTPDLEWFTTRPDKASYLASLEASTGAATAQAVSEPASAPITNLPGTFPIGVAADGRTVLLYLATQGWTEAFRTFVQGHVPLLRVAPRWTLRIVFPRPLERGYDAYVGVIREELESPLHPATVSELRWYFEHRERATHDAIHPQAQAFVNVGASAFAAPRFRDLYDRWLRHGSAVFDGPSSPVIAEALDTGAGRVESLVLAHSYRHLSPLVDQPRVRTNDVEKRVEKGATRGDIMPPRPQPPLSTPWLPRERSVLM